jgi:RNA polymerase sigma factor (sigma-70 family)
MEASAVPRVAPTGVTGVASPQLLRLASDARLVALVRQGWPAAFEAVYNRHQRGILSFCRHVLSDADEAEDAVQHTFLAAYNDLIASDKPIHLRAWLFTIARNRCYSILRARREQPAADLDEPVTEGLATQVQRRQDLRDLVVDLRGLPDEQRAALVLAELDALSHEEIGEALGVPRDKVKALVFQARESLVASRTARETACADIREQLSNGRGGTLRRANLRRHLRDCSGCRDFRRQVERQRRQLTALLPVAPTLALKEAVLTGTGSTGAGVSGGGLIASAALKSGVLKGFATLVLATAGTAGTYVATHAFPAHTGSRTAPRAQSPAPATTLSTIIVRPPAPRTANATPSIRHAAPAARPQHRSLRAIHFTRLTAPARAGNGVLHPFGPLVHSRAAFPRKASPRVRTIAPPASTGKAPTPTMLAPATVASVPSGAITPTTPAPRPRLGGDPKPVSDLPTATGDAPGDSRSTSVRPRSSSSGASRPQVVRGRVPASGKPRGIVRRGGTVVPGKPITRTGAGDPRTTTVDPGARKGQAPAATTTEPGASSAGGSRGDASGGTAGRTSIVVVLPALSPAPASPGGR